MTVNHFSFRCWANASVAWTALLPIMVCGISHAKPLTSQDDISPGALSIPTSESSFISLRGTLFMGDLQSSGYPVSEIYPETRRQDSLHLSGLELRLAPSFLLLADNDFVRLLQIHAEFSTSRNSPYGGNSNQSLRPQPIRAANGEPLRVTESYLRLVGSHLAAKVGRERIRFGLGISGNSAWPRWGSFAPGNVGHLPLGGDISERASFTYAPLGFGTKKTTLALLAGVESVIEDDRISRVDGDSAEGYFLGLQMAQERFTLQLALLSRDMEYREGGVSDLNIASVYVDANSNTSVGRVHLASELTWVKGTTTLPEAVFVDQTFEVNNGGGVLRLWLERPSDVLGFELGYASGDANRYDHHVRNFQFDPNYRVGMLIFPTVNAQQMLISAQNASDPEYREKLPRGVDRTPSAGAVENALYLTPAWVHNVSQRASAELRYLAAWRAAPSSDIFRTGLNGGVPTNHFGGQNSNYLGQEVNLAFNLTKNIAGFETRLTGGLGIAWLGETPPTANGRVYGSTVRTEITW